MERDIRLDAVKGLAIILIVLGHLIHEGLIFRICYSFHLALLFGISGWVLYGRDVKITKKAKQLLLPYVSWMILFQLLYWRTTEINWTSHFWYLLVLFLFCLILWGVQIASRHVGWLREWMLFLPIWFALAYVPLKYGLNPMNFMWPFFFGGYLLAGKNLHLSRRAIALGLIIFPLNFYAMRSIPMAVGSHMNRILQTKQTPFLWLSRYGVAIAGVLFAVSLVLLLGKYARPLAIIGWFSIDIYLMHAFFVPLGAWAIPLCIVVPPIAGSIIRKVPVARTLLLGGRDKACPWLPRITKVSAPLPETADRP